MRIWVALAAFAGCALAIFSGTDASALTDFEKGRLAYDAQDYDNAERYLKLALQQKNKDPQIHYYLANTLSVTGKFDQARTHYQTCLKLGPTSEAAQLSKTGLLNLDFVAGLAGSGQSQNLQSTRPDEGRFVRQFVSNLDNQVDDRKQLARMEAEQLQFAHSQMLWSQQRRHARHHRYSSDFSPFDFGLNSPQNNFLEGNFNFASRRRYGSYGFNRYNPSFQRELGFEQSASGLESQMLNQGNGVRLNPRGTNLYVRNYGNGQIAEPPPVVELLARQEKLVIDREPAQR